MGLNPAEYAKPYFTIDGIRISDSGGQVIHREYRSKANARMAFRSDYVKGPAESADFPDDDDDWDELDVAPIDYGW